MIRPRWQKALSDITGNLIRSLLVIASIMVGLFAVGIIVTIHSTLQQDMSTGYALSNPANILITTGWFDQTLVDNIARLKGVAAVEGVTNLTLRARTGKNEWASFALQAAGNFRQRKLNQVILKSGRWPPQRREVVLDQNKLHELHAGLNSTLEVELPDGTSTTFTVSGIVQDQTIGAFSIGGGFFIAPEQGYIDASSLSYLNLPDRMNTLYITIEGDGTNYAEINQVTSRVRDELEHNGFVIHNSAERASDEHPNIHYVDAIAGTLFLLGFLIVFLSGFLITNTLSALLNQQIVQIGIMKTFGARRSQIIGIYMMVILFFGATACAISIPLSHLAASALMRYLGGMINIALQGERLVPASVVLQIVIALLVPQVAGFFPILRGSRIPVQTALSGSLAGDSATGSRPRQRIRVRRISRPLLISMRNTFRSKSRLLLTLITLSLSGAIFIATFNVRSSLQVYIDQILQYFLADVNVTLDSYQRADRVEAVMRRVPDVAYVEHWLAARAKIVTTNSSEDQYFTLFAPPSGSKLVKPILISGRWIQPGDTNTITLNERFLSQYPGIQLGDTIKMDLYGQEDRWVVVGFFQLAGKSGGLLAYTNYEHLSRILSVSQRSNTYRVVSQRANLTVTQQEELGKAIEAELQKAGLNVTELTAGKYTSTSTARGLDTLTTFLLIMATLTALVGSIGLTGTMSLNVMERTREIGVMRAIGASDGTLFRLVVTEGGLIGLISWVAGSLLSFPISRLMSDRINAAIFDAPSNFTWTVNGFLIWLVVVVLLSIVASLIPARNATRLTIREVLAYE